VLSSFLESLVELLKNFFWQIMPFVVMNCDECGVVLRLGKYHRDLAVGFNWKYPFGIEREYCTICALNSVCLREQSLTSKDGKSVTVRGVIAYRITDPKKYILDTGTAESVINDVGCCVICDVIPEFEASEILTGETINEKLLSKMRSRAAKWGVKVDSIGLVDRTQARTYRLLLGERSPTTDHVV
jgi:regulator of protease activity HflC (stomatin/prohibitin superfamily)